MPLFSERFAGTKPTKDLAPAYVRMDALDILRPSFPEDQLRNIVCKTLGATPINEWHWSSDNHAVWQETRALVSHASWTQFYDIIEAAIAQAEMSDTLIRGVDRLLGLLAHEGLPWRISLEKVVGDRDALRAVGIPPTPARTGVVPSPRGSPTAAKDSDSRAKPPQRLPNELFIVLGILATLAGTVATTSGDALVKIWASVLTMCFVIALVGALVVLMLAESSSSLRTSRYIWSIVAAGTILSLSCGVFLSRDPLHASSTKSTVETMSGIKREQGGVEQPRRPSTMSVSQRTTIAQFARQYPRHSVFIWAAGSDNARSFATSLADALESGGWTVGGRADARRGHLVTFRLGPVIGADRRIAVAPADGLGADLADALRKIGLRPEPWLPSLPDASTDARIWFAP